MEDEADGDTVQIEGWLNTGPKTTTMQYVRGSHEETQIRGKKRSFMTGVEVKDVATISIPPGHMVVYPQWLIRCDTVDTSSYKLHTAYVISRRMTGSNYEQDVETATEFDGTRRVMLTFGDLHSVDVDELSAWSLGTFNRRLLACASVSSNTDGYSDYFLLSPTPIPHSLDMYTSDEKSIYNFADTFSTRTSITDEEQYTYAM